EILGPFLLILVRFTSMAQQAQIERLYGLIDGIRVPLKLRNPRQISMPRLPVCRSQGGHRDCTPQTRLPPGLPRSPYLTPRLRCGLARLCPLTCAGLAIAATRSTPHRTP